MIEAAILDIIHKLERKAELLQSDALTEEQIADHPKWPFPVDARVLHHKHGAGVVTKLLEDGRTRGVFDSGEEHKYKTSSMYKMRAVEEFASTTQEDAAMSGAAQNLTSRVVGYCGLVLNCWICA